MKVALYVVMNIRKKQKGGNGAISFDKKIEGGEERQQLDFFREFKTERKQIK